MRRLQSPRSICYKGPTPVTASPIQPSHDGFEILEPATCNLCGSARSERLFASKERQYRDISCLVEFGVVQCADCGHVYLSPRVKQEFISTFYPKTYYTRSARPEETQFRRAKRDIYRLIAQRYFGYPEVLTEQQEWLPLLSALLPLLYLVYGFRFRRILPYTPGGRMLDFGFGGPDYLILMRDLGWDCWGIDADQAWFPLLKERGISVGDDLFAKEIPQGGFDWITSYHSLEHIYDPKGSLLRFSHLLKPGGHLYLGVPNFDSLPARLWGPYWYNLSVPIHINFFSPRSLERLLGEAGFRITKLQYRSLPEDFPASLQFFWNQWISTISGEKRTSMFLRDWGFARLAFLPLSFMLDLLRMGDRIEVTAVKR